MIVDPRHSAIGNQMAIESGRQGKPASLAVNETQLARDLRDPGVAAGHARDPLETLHDPALILTPEEIVLSANDAACRLYGFRREELVGLDMKTISTDVAAGERQMERVLRGENVHFRSRQRRRDGTPLDLDIEAKAIDYGNGTGVLTINREVRKTAPLPPAEERNRIAIEEVPIGVCRLTPTGEFVAANQTLADLLGFERNSLIAIGSVSRLFAVHAEWRQIESDVLREGIAQRSCTIRRADGRLIPADVYARISAEGIDAFVIDLAPLREVEQEREEIAMELQTLLAATKEGVCVADAEGRCTAVNAAAARMLRLDPASITGRPLHDVIHHSDADETNCRILQVASTGAPAHFDELLWRADGEPLHTEISAVPIMIAGRPRGLVVAFSESRGRAAREAAEKEQGEEKLAGAIAHEFNNVLMAVLPLCEILERRVTDPKLIRLMAGMRSSVIRGKRLTQEILRFTRHRKPSLRPLEVGPYVIDLGRELTALLGRSLTIQVEVPDEPLRILGDPIQLREAFTQIALNARDAMPGGGTVTIAALRHSAGDWPMLTTGAGVAPSVHFRITDTGAGMSAEAEQHAFEPLFTTKGSASGMGLAFARRVIRDHGGEIFIETLPDRGTSIHVLIPLMQDDVRPDDGPPIRG